MMSKRKEKKEKLEDVYSDGRSRNEDKYEIMKVQKIIRTHILKYVKFSKVKETKSAGKSFKKNNAKMLQYDTSHKQADILKRVGYEYNITKLVGYYENTRSLIDRVF